MAEEIKTKEEDLLDQEQDLEVLDLQEEIII